MLGLQYRVTLRLRALLMIFGLLDQDPSGPLTIGLIVVARSGHVEKNFETDIVKSRQNRPESSKCRCHNRTEFINTDKVVVINGQNDLVTRELFSSFLVTRDFEPL